MSAQEISRQTLQRLPLYTNYLRALPEGSVSVSSTDIAAGLGLNPVQVRKDLAAVGSGGRPRTGYQTQRLLSHLMAYLGKGQSRPAVLAGVGSLGHALALYRGFADYGVEIVALFDRSPALVGSKCGERTILSMEAMEDACRELASPIGIITVPDKAAQEVCDRMVKSGVKAIWNFAPTCLTVPPDVAVLNENMAASLALLTARADALAQSHGKELAGD